MSALKRLSIKCPLAVIALRHHHMTLSQPTISCQFWLVLRPSEIMFDLWRKQRPWPVWSPSATCNSCWLSMVDCHLRQQCDRKLSKHVWLCNCIASFMALSRAHYI